MDLEAELGGIPTRPMRVKVLYTFDAAYKTTCLARLPDTLNIPTVAIDDKTQIGVIELRQCIQAIMSSSPELISRLAEGDFTIYAYDYSEYETPLVGQGMLSALLAAHSSTPGAPAHQSKTMITGRVCKNMLAAFSNGVKETLEVKLRMVPVPKKVQREYVRSMDSSFRSASPATSVGFDSNAWQQSQQHHPGVDNLFAFDEQASQHDQEQSLLEDIFSFGERQGGGDASGQGGSAGEGGIAETPLDSAFAPNPAFSAQHPHSAPGSRAGSPMMGSEAATHNSHLRHQSFSGGNAGFEAGQNRPDSRASMRSEYNQAPHNVSQHVQSQQQQQTEVYYGDDGQPRKRARVMQADWRGKSAFGKKSSDLRVTAATASSLHMHRPVARRSKAPGSDLEPPPRVPTPVPQLDRALCQQRLSGGRSLLRQASTASMIGSDFMSDIDSPAMSEAVMSSPEEDRSPSDQGQGTPQHIPSSPPVFPEMQQMLQPSSPGLPTLHSTRLADSGYMSDARGFMSSNTFDYQDDDERSPNAQDHELAGQYAARAPSQQRVKEESITPSGRSEKHGKQQVATNQWLMQTPGDMSQLPEKMLLNLQPGKREPSRGPTKASRPSLTKKASNVSLPPPSMPTPMAYNEPTPAPEATQSRRSSLALPSKPIQQSQPKPAAQKRPTAQRARTDSMMYSDTGSPAPSDNEGPSSRPKGPNRSGSGAPRRKVIEQRLQDSLAKGEVPPYCSHCGALETPTWRRLYLKLCPGKPSPLDSVEGEGETVAVEEIEWDDETGNCVKFVIRKSMKKMKDSTVGEGFRDVQVCNPCGLWFNKFRNMRPPDRWNRKTGRRNKKKAVTGSNDICMSTDAVEPPSEAFLPQSDAFFTDAAVPGEGSEDDGVRIKEDSTEAFDIGEYVNGSQQAAQSFQSRPRSNSMQMPQTRKPSDAHWTTSQLDAALARAVQSSPARFQGSKESPIELDELTPKPTRRQLFPSPRQDGEFRSLEDDDLLSLKRKSPLSGGKGGNPFAAMKRQRTAPGNVENVDIFDAFVDCTDKENMAPPLGDEDDLAHLFEGSPSALFKTPAKQTTPRKRSPGSSGRSRQTNFLKTPTPASRKKQRKPLSPNANAANNANLNSAFVNNSAAADWLTSPSSSRYFLRSTPTRLANTPGRHSQPGSQHSGRGSVANASDLQMTPFSKHLAQMLNQHGGEDDGNNLTSPSRAFDFSEMPTFTTPGRPALDWGAVEGILSSEFGVYEDDE